MLLAALAGLLSTLLASLPRLLGLLARLLTALLLAALIALLGLLLTLVHPVVHHDLLRELAPSPNVRGNGMFRRARRLNGTGFARPAEMLTSRRPRRVARISRRC
ncbi:MAG TPA: hypothetical protein VHA55_01395 [Pseudorhodoplanes sp.]|nr:hypothetical protein [Pseudorhodoplanes sp.]